MERPRRPRTYGKRSGTSALFNSLAGTKAPVQRITQTSTPGQSIAVSHTTSSHINSSRPPVRRAPFHSGNSFTARPQQRTATPRAATPGNFQAGPRPAFGTMKPRPQRTFVRGSAHGKQGNAPVTTTAHREPAPIDHSFGQERSTPAKKHDVIPPLKERDVRIIPLGGVEQIGKNMTAIEYGNDIIVVDAGFQFRDDDTPGIDYILPNTKYLEENKHKVRALLITHGHLDHIGAIPYIMDRIGNPPLYSRMLTTVMIRKRQEEFPQVPPLNIQIVEKDSRIKIGELYVKFFSVTHTIPDAMGVIIETPHGSVVHTGDLKLDHEDGIPTEKEEKEYEKFKNEKVLLLMSDSTNVELPGFSIPEKIVHKNIEEIIRNVQGRLIIGTFASLLERIIKIIEISERLGKKVVVEGRSMKVNIEIAIHLGLLKCKEGTLITAEEMESIPPERIVAVATGAQGDEFAALMRMAQKQHKYFKINKRDTIMLSSSVIPGNERAVQKLKDNLSRQGAKIIHYKVADIHSSGHANREETAWIQRKINPKFFIPVHGYHYMLRVHGDIARGNGIPEENIVIPDNGMVIEIRDNGSKIVTLKEKAPSGIVMVDGFSIGDIQEVVIRDRQMLAEDGMFVIIASVNTQTGELKKSPDIISRGFVYLRESQELLHQTRIIIKRSVEETAHGMNPINFEYIKEVMTDNVGRYLYQKTNKRPIVIPVLLGV
jgi:ribonuclease J